MTTFDLDFIMAVEEGDPDLTLPELIEGVQDGIDSGVVWQLQGYWGRLAASMIEDGYCHTREEEA